ncbi:MAG: hypothetical protein BRD38_05500 [Bacteroidetes bacterium QH_9_67_14]|jgi:hypothetical protein|nr:MAG: hypothetical protein BRD38_05500 [Bacteroidetes bacterium QH_9_67_14]
MDSETGDRNSLFGDKITSRRTAIAWAVLFGAGTALAKKAGTRYLMGENVRLEWADLTTALVSGTLSYFSFRQSHDDDFPLAD